MAENKNPALHPAYIEVLTKLASGEIDVSDGFNALKAVTDDLKHKSNDQYNKKWTAIQSEKQAWDDTINLYSERAIALGNIIINENNDLYPFVMQYLNEKAKENKRE